MADWITVSPTEPDGGYTDANTDITMTYAQNTTPSTRAATLTFVNAIAEEKHDYNPDSPDGQVQYKVYQFGRRELRITVDSDNYSVTTSNTAPPTTYVNAAWDDTQYSQSHSIALDFTTNVGGSGITNQQNAEGLNRDYYTSNDNAVPGTMTIQVTSTSPWFIAEGAGWTGVPAAYYNSTRFSTDYKQPRTFDGSDNATPVSVDIAISPNNGGNARSTALYIVNKQGYIQTLNITQKGYVVPNQPPVAGFTLPAADCPGQTVTIDASSSYDPDGVITNYIWGGVLSGCGNSVTCSYTLPANSNCTASSQVYGSLRVRDDRNAYSTTRSIPLVVLPRQICEGGVTANCPADLQVANINTSSGTLNFSASATPISGCQTSPASITSISPSNSSVTFIGNSGSGSWVGSTDFGLTQNGQTGTVTLNVQDGNSNTDSCTTTITYGTPNQAPSPSISFSGDGNQSSATGTVTATCSPNDPDNTGPYSYTWGGDFSGSNSTSSYNFSGLNPGDTQNISATCQVTDSGIPPATGNGSASTTVSRSALTYNCNGYQDCSSVTDGSGTYSTLAACQASSCYNTQPANLTVSSGCSTGNTVATNGTFSCSPYACVNGPATWSSFVSTNNGTISATASGTCSGTFSSCFIESGTKSSLIGSMAPGLGQGSCVCTYTVTHSNGDTATINLTANSNRIDAVGQGICSSASLFNTCNGVSSGC